MMSHLKNRHKKIVYSVQIKKDQEASYDELARALSAILGISVVKTRYVLYSGGVNSLSDSSIFLELKAAERNMLESIIKSVSIEKELEDDE